jgi:hypothetical protein
MIIQLIVRFTSRGYGMWVEVNSPSTRMKASPSAVKNQKKALETKKAKSEPSDYYD